MFTTYNSWCHFCTLAAIEDIDITSAIETSHSVKSHALPLKLMASNVNVHMYQHFTLFYHICTHDSHVKGVKVLWFLFWDFFNILY